MFCLYDTYRYNAHLAMNQNEWITNQGSLIFNPSQLLIAYDNNGQVINAGDYKFDSQTLLKFNALLNIEPRRDFDHVFVDGFPDPITNITTTIHSVKLPNESDPYYFDTFNHLKLFMLNYIKKHLAKV